jgi:hypothetical protein
MAYAFQPVTLNPDQVITAAQVNHLPIIAHYARRLGLEARNATLPGWDNKPTPPPHRLHDDQEVQGRNRPRRGPTTPLGKTPLARSEGLLEGFAGPRALFYSSASC